MNESKPYYFTFGQSHPLRNHWIEIHAVDGEIALEKMLDFFGINWHSQYDDADFKPEDFPAGRAGEIVEVI